DAAGAEHRGRHALADALGTQRAPKIERIGHGGTVEREDDVADEQAGRRRTAGLDLDHDHRALATGIRRVTHAVRYADPLRAHAEKGLRHTAVTDHGVDDLIDGVRRNGQVQVPGYARGVDADDRAARVHQRPAGESRIEP